MPKPLHTSALARAVGVHPNTIRRYEMLGLIPPVPRSPNRYRYFDQSHLHCAQLVHLIYMRVYVSQVIRASALNIIPLAVAGDWQAALSCAKDHLALVQAEQAQAEIAVQHLERWAAGVELADPRSPQRIGQVAHSLGLSIDILRNWERDGLLSVPRHANGYRAYGAEDISRLQVIRMLSRAGFSHMAILRMMLQLDQGNTTDLRHALDTPRPIEEDLYTASDRWLSTLAEQAHAAQEIIVFIQGVLYTRDISGMASPR